MPYKLIQSVRIEKSIPPHDAAALAKLFNVSETAMKIRLGINY
jgi:hypothetical protein